MRSYLPRIERARPLLGTRVAVRVEGLSQNDAHRAIDVAFEEIAIIHRLMSFHEPDSDVSSLNRQACEGDIRVDPRTCEVLVCARDMSLASDGCFDITVAPELAAWGMLPVPQGACRPDPDARWSDIALGEDSHVRFLRPLWIDLGGIAKGYAIDRAVEKLRAAGAVQGSVNAGGDLRIFGPASERVLLQPAHHGGEAAPVLEIADAAVASSSGHLERRERAGEIRGPHLDGGNRRGIPTGRFVSVVARSCMIADALTKIVLARQDSSEPVLQRYAASAHLHDPERGWRHFGIA